MKDKLLLKHYLLNRDEIKLKYFCTLTFGEEARKYTEEEKIELVRKFIHKLRRKKAFEYFWVKEKEKEELHVHLVTTWEYSYDYICKKWNEMINIREDAPSTRIDSMEESSTSYENRVNYLFKDELRIYGISSEIKRNYVNYTKNLNYNELNSILLDEKVKVEKKEYKEGSISEEEIMENEIVEIYNEKEMNPTIVDWMFKMNVYLSKEKTRFIEFVKKGEEQQLIWYKQKIKEENYINLWKGLLFFYMINGLRGRKILYHTLYDNMRTLLYMVITDKINWEDLIDIESDMDMGHLKWFELACVMEFYFMTVMKEYISIEQEMEANKVYNLIKIKKEFKDIKLGNEFINYKGKKPMIVKPKDWTLNLNDGGYIYNNKLFSFNLCKKNYASELEIKSQRALDNLNYLQNTKYRINSYLLNYINVNKELICKELFEDNTELSLEKEYKIVKSNLQLEYKGKEKKDINKEKVKKLMERKSYILKVKNEINKFENIIKIANYLDKYNEIYFMIQLDFRGRVNIISDYLNYQGENLAKALIYLTKESKINIYWFKIYSLKKYGENLTGLNVKQMHELFDIKLKELMINYKKNKCWLEAEDKFEFLNCCLEYEKYLIFGENYKTRMPIYFDATCSGSQLITLLLGIDEYVEDLNLKASSEMNELKDYYLKIINNYKEKLLVSLEKQETEKKELLFFIKTDADWRKFFKKIIMTLNYGLTSGGLMIKITEKKKEFEWEFSKELIKKIYTTFKDYISEISLVKSLNIFSEIVQEVSELNKDVYIYTTYKGFVEDKTKTDYIFRQGYRKYHLKTIGFDKRKLQKYELDSNKKVKINDIKKRYRKKYTFLNIDYNKVDKKQQSLAFKANIIHHLDAMWIHGCLDKLSKVKDFGGIFVVHDCFGVGFDDIQTLNKIVRKCLIEFFSQDNTYKLLYNIKRSKYQKDYRLSMKEEEEIKNITKEIESKYGNSRDKIMQDLEYAYYLIFPG
jgi:hypothetical protein